MAVDWEVYLSMDCLWGFQSLFGTSSSEWVGTVFRTLRVCLEQQSHKYRTGFTYYSLVTLKDINPVHVFPIQSIPLRKTKANQKQGQEKRKRHIDICSGWETITWWSTDRLSLSPLALSFNSPPPASELWLFDSDRWSSFVRLIRWPYPMSCAS